MHRKCHDVLFLFMIPPFFISISFLLFIDMCKILYKIHCLDVLLEDTDIGKALTDYVAYAKIEKLVLGAPRHGFLR